MSRLYATAGVLALAAVLGWTSYQILSQRAADPFADCRTGNVAGGTIGGSFTLINELGQTVTDQDLFAKPALVYFGFASCADVCPLDNARNVAAAALLAAQGIDATPIFITVDPGRDTPKVLLDYTNNFGEQLLGLTGSIEQVKAATAAFKGYFKIPDNAGANYEVDHTTLTYLVLPKTGFADFFPRETSAKDMAERAGCFVKAS